MSSVSRGRPLPHACPRKGHQAPLRRGHQGRVHRPLHREEGRVRQEPEAGGRSADLPGAGRVAEGGEHYA